MINPVLPNRKVKDKDQVTQPILPEDCVVEWQDTLFMRNYDIRIFPPYGEETFKVFLSEQPLDLEEILTSGKDSNSRGGGVLNDLARVFNESEVNESGTRGNSNVNTSKDGTVFSFNFSIVPK